MSVLKLVKSYNFVDKDPAIDYLRPSFEANQLTVNALAVQANVSPSTVSNIFYGATRKPQFATMVRIARAIGPEGERALIECVKNGGTSGVSAEAGQRMARRLSK